MTHKKSTVHVIRMFTLTSHGGAHSAYDRDSEIEITRVKYNQYTLCRLTVLSKWLKICSVMKIRGSQEPVIAHLVFNLTSKVDRNGEVTHNFEGGPPKDHFN